MGTSRRALLRATAAGAAAGLLGPEFAYARVPALAGKAAIVVGSGFGGAVAAYRLAKAGVRTTVLERGRRWDVDPAGSTFSTTADPDWRSAWFSTEPPFGGFGDEKPIEKGAGIVAKHEGDGINVVSGAGVGGGSLIYSTFLPQPRRSEWTKVYPAGVSYDDMEQVYWPRARQALGASPLPADIESHPKYAAARAWKEYVAEFGQSAVAVPFGVDWDRIRAELAGTAPACHTIGEGALGSNSGAKNSVDRNYLKWAVDTGNVTVSPLHEVTEIHEVGQDRFEVRYRQIDEHGDVLATGTTGCDYLFLAAGSFYTTSLLVTAKAKGWLPRLGAAVGQGFGNNGDFLVVRLNLRKPVGWAQAGPGNVKFVDDQNQYAPTAMGWEAQPMPPQLPKPATSHVITTLTPERGEIRYDPQSGAGKVRWPFAAMQTQGDKAGRDLVNRLWWQTEVKTGHTFNGLPTYDRNAAAGLGSANTWHPLGGMVMGQATDLAGGSVDYPNLYCVDGSVLPGSTALANPALTITANAERIMDLFLASHA